MGPEQKLELLHGLLLVRRFEERVKELYNEGTIVGAIHLYIGQEAVAVGVCAALSPEDYVFSTHRGHGHALAKSGDVDRIMAELMGRDTGLSRGHGGSMHLYDPDRGLMGGNGIVGGGIPLSLGAAFSARYRGTDQVSVTFFSDGASNQGTFAECLNLAALFSLPVLFICENNQYAATTPVRQSTARQVLVDRARSYGLPAEQVDGNDVLAVHAAAEAAVAGMRKGGGPYFLECVTYRIEPHCGIIPDEREPGERESWSERDPIAMLQERLRDEDGVPEKELAAVDTSVQETIGHAVEYALSSPWPDPTAAHNRTWILG